MKVNPDGTVTGYTIDMTNAALEGLGLPKLKPAAIDWGAMIPALLARQVDMVAPGLQITEERCNAVIFSGPTFVMQYGIYVPSGNANSIAALADFKTKPDLKLAVINGSSQDSYAVGAGVPESQLVRVPDIQAGVAAMKGRRADAFLVGQFSIEHPGEKGLDVIVDPEFPLFAYAIALRKEDKAFRDGINTELDKLRDDGRMEKAFGDDPAVVNMPKLMQYRRASDIYPNCE